MLLTSAEEKGQVFLGLHHDTHPQLLIDNRSGAKLYLSQRPKVPKTIPANPCPHFRWTHSVENAQTLYHTMCGYADKFPALNHACGDDNLTISCDGDGVQWSTPIDVQNYNDQFIRVPFLGDVKVSVVGSAHATLVAIASASTVEINARDIRVRLYMRENQEPSGSAGGSVEESLEMCGFDVPPPPMKKSYAGLAEVSRPEIPKSLVVRTLPVRPEWSAFKVSVLLNAFSVTFISDVENGCEQTEVASVVLDDVLLVANQEQVIIVLFFLSKVKHVF